MGKLASNLPLGSANIVDGVVVSVWASKVRVTWDPAANPAPLAVTTVPTVPVVDERVSFVVIVYVATLCKPFESWARTLQPPVGLFGAAKEAVKAPYGSAVMDGGVVVIEFPANVRTIDELAVNPAPLIVNTVPTTPLEGDRVIRGVTVNAAEAAAPSGSIADIR